MVESFSTYFCKHRTVAFELAKDVDKDVEPQETATASSILIMGDQTNSPRHLTIAEELKYWATHNPVKPAFIFVDVTWRRRVLSRADVYRLASRYAAILRRHGIKHGDIVCNTLPNSPERLISDLGIVLAGAAAMNGQLFLADGADFIGSVKEAGCHGIVLDPLQPKGAASVLEARVHSQKGNHISYPDLPNLHQLFLVYWTSDDKHESFFDMLEKEQESFVADSSPRDVAEIWTTSGSTGFSKLVPRTHEAALNFGHAFHEFVGMTEDDIYYNDRALGWAGGFPGNFLRHGNTRVLPDVTKGLPDDLIPFVWDLARKESCTVALFLPSQLLQLTDHVQQLNDQGKNDFKMRLVASGGQPLRKKHMDALGILTDTIHCGYGSTEAGAISIKSVSVTDKHTYEDCNNGCPVTGVELRVVDDDMKDVANGQLGEIILRSPQLFTSYLNNEAATRKAFVEDGWFRTGDVGHVNSQREVFVVCRKAFSIMRGPYLLYPGWLEDRIGRCPGIEDVMVVPVPDPVLYQELCACVITQPGASLTEEAVREFCKELFLTSDKSEMTAVPKYYLFFQHFPTTNTGKTCRRTTAKVVLQRLGLDMDTSCADISK